MNRKEEIIRLRQKGLTIRAIQKELGISSPSVVHWHLKHTPKVRSWLKELVVLPERFPNAGDKQSELMCAGFNEYRRLILERVSQSGGSKT